MRYPAITCQCGKQMYSKNRNDVQSCETCYAGIIGPMDRYKIINYPLEFGYFEYGKFHFLPEIHKSVVSTIKQSNFAIRRRLKEVEVEEQQNVIKWLEVIMPAGTNLVTKLGEQISVVYWAYYDGVVSLFAKNGEGINEYFDYTAIDFTEIDKKITQWQNR